MALVAFGHPLRRREPGIELAARRADRPLLEGDRLVPAARAGILRLSRDLHGSGGEHERRVAQSFLRTADDFEEHSIAGARRYRLSWVRAGAQCGDAGLSVARSMGAGA